MSGEPSNRSSRRSLKRQAKKKERKEQKNSRKHNPSSQASLQDSSPIPSMAESCNDFESYSRKTIDLYGQFSDAMEKRQQQKALRKIAVEDECHSVIATYIDDIMVNVIEDPIFLQQCGHLIDGWVPLTANQVADLLNKQYFHDRFKMDPAVLTHVAGQTSVEVITYLKRKFTTSTGVVCDIDYKFFNENITDEYGIINIDPHDASIVIKNIVHEYMSGTITREIAEMTTISLYLFMEVSLDKSKVMNNKANQETILADMFKCISQCFNVFSNSISVYLATEINRRIDEDLIFNSIDGYYEFREESAEETTEDDVVDRLAIMEI